ncbi:hypothetical protein A3Q56_01840 [Intoshia linei]|uniref:Proteasome subunit alpha type n=1 Tax=Intoshia linei TaxID=1819745 RepID=A0A177B7Z6_9BILA|nr:hypothetical protein A3Q56_01840 [Intoshia linei]
MASSRYDRAITVFSPDGHLFQVEYAQEAVKKGHTVIGVRGKNCVAFAVEKKTISTLHVDRTVTKIYPIDENITVAFSGLSADARVLINRIRVECQSQRLTYADVPSTEVISRFIANYKQDYTQKIGRRPFGVSLLIAGFDDDGTPHLYKTDPSGTYHEWKACVVGKNDKSVMEFLEKKLSKNENFEYNEDDTIKLAIMSMCEHVQAKSEKMEIVIMGKKKFHVSFYFI